MAISRARAKNVGFSFVLVVVATLLSLALAETALRLFAPQALMHDPDAFIPNPTLGARLQPGFSDRFVTTEFSSSWIINEDGYRGPRAGQRYPASFRIVALGDSFTFGYGVEEHESWPRVLETIAGMTRWLYMAEYIPPRPIGFVKSARRLLQETEKHFDIRTKLTLDDEHTMLLAETRKA